MHFRGALITAIAARGHKVFAAAPSISETSEQLRALGAEPIDVPLVNASLNPFAMLRSLRELRKIIRRLGPDVLISYTIVGQSIQVETNGVTNTVFFDPAGVARIQTPSGNSVPGTWAAANGQLCLSTGGAQECWPYARPFQAGQQVGLTSNCNASSRWTALGTNQSAPVQQGAGERG